MGPLIADCQDPAGCLQHTNTYLVADGVAQQRNRMGLPLQNAAESGGWLVGMRFKRNICVPAPNHCRGGLHSLRAQHGGSHHAANVVCALRRGGVCSFVLQLSPHVDCCCLMYCTSGSSCASLGVTTMRVPEVVQRRLVHSHEKRCCWLTTDASICDQNKQSQIWSVLTCLRFRALVVYPRAFRPEYMLHLMAVPPLLRTSSRYLQRV
jgi:hypothetical protein